MSEASFSLSGRIQTAGLKGMIHYFEIIANSSTNNLRTINWGKWEYVYSLVDKCFTWIDPQEVGKSAMATGIPGCLYEYYDILVSDMENTFPWLPETLLEELEERIQKLVIQNVDAASVRSIIHSFVGKLEPADRKRIDEEKLFLLVLFVYDYCMSFFTDSELDSSFLRFCEDRIRIGSKQFAVSKAEHYAIKNKLKTPIIIGTETAPDGSTCDGVVRQDYCLSFPNGVFHIPHPKDKPQYKSIMFLDLIHKFLNHLGLKKRQYKQTSSEFNPKEKDFVLKLLVCFGFCGSKKPSKSYFQHLKSFLPNKYLLDCNVLSWIRCNSYHYILPISPNALFSEEFKQVEDMAVEDTSPANSALYAIRENSGDFFSDICGYKVNSTLILGHSFKCVHVDRDFARLIDLSEKESFPEYTADDPLAYVYMLLFNRFSFLQVLPIDANGSIPIAKYDIKKQDVFSVVRESLVKDILDRQSIIAKNPLLFDGFKADTQSIKEAVNKAITDELYGDDAERLNVDQLYYLVLFISDYCVNVFKKANLHPVYKRFEPKKVEIDGDKIQTSTEVYELIMSYLKRPLKTCAKKGALIRFGPRDGQLYPVAPSPKMHPEYDMKNFIAMFCDLFRSFLKTFGTSHREGASLSDQDKYFIASILNSLGYAKASNKIVSTYLAERAPISSDNPEVLARHYVRQCELYNWLREGPYGYLYPNDMDDELYGPMI